MNVWEERAGGVRGAPQGPRAGRTHGRVSSREAAEGQEASGLHRVRGFGWGQERMVFQRLRTTILSVCRGLGARPALPCGRF